MSLALRDSHELGGLRSREIGLWATAGALMFSVHVAAAWYAQQEPAMAMPQEQAQSAVMIDLAPMAMAPEAVPLDTTDLVDSAASEEVKEVVEPTETVTPEETAEPVTEPVQEVAEALPEPVEEVVEEPLEEVIPDLVELPLPEVAMAVPLPRPEIAKPKPVEKPVREKPKVEKRKPLEKPVQEVRKQPAPSSASAAKSAQASDTTRAPTPGAGSGRSMSPDRWQARVNAHLNRYKRSAGARGAGTAFVRFAINPSGDVLSASLARSSGNPALDDAAVAIIRRASPVPAPPPEIARSSMSLMLPVEFSRR